MKNILRKEILSIRKSRPENFRTANSIIINEKLLKTDEFTEAKTVMFYLSKEDEVRTELAINVALKLGKRVVVPMTKEKTLSLSELNEDTELEAGCFGVPEPKTEHVRKTSAEGIDLVVIPGIAFDAKGNRIGYGKGYYDDFLKTLAKKVPITALAYDFQVVDKIENSCRDVPVDKIITEKRVIDCTS